MELTLRRALEETALREAEVVAGKGALDARIREVNIIEVPEVSRWMQGGELLFSTGYAFGGNIEKGCELIENLKRHHITALAIKPGKYLSEIPAEMAAYADQLDFPLLKLPEDKPYMYFMEPIYEILLNQKVTRLQQIAEFHEHLLHAQMSGGVQAICDIFSAFIERPVFFTEADGRIAVGARPKPETPEDKEAVDEIRRLISDYVLKGPLMKTTRLLRRKRMDGAGRVVCTPLYVNNEFTGCLLVDECLRELDASDAAALKYTVSLISLELLNEQSLREKEQQVRGELLDDLLRQSYEDDELIYRRSRFIHFDLSRPFFLFILGIRPAERLLESAVSAELQAKSAGIRSDAIKALNRQFGMSRKSCMLLGKNSGVVGIVSVSEASERIGIDSIVTAVVTHARKLYPDFHIFAGFGRAYDDLHKIPTSYSEAILAERVGHKIYPQKAFISFDDLGIFRFLYELKASPVMLEFYHENMDVLLEYDKANNSSLVHTLVCYFNQKGNLRETAEVLFVHKNSVIYRIKKIEKLTKKSLQDVDAAFNLQLCLKIMEILK